jgi:DNA-binding MarR family transcriptional regulator
MSLYDIIMEATRDLSLGQYRDLAEFRMRIRQFLHFSEASAREHGLEPQQHQLLLTLHGLPEGVRPTIGELATRLFIQPHSAVELVNRLANTGAVVRSPGPQDKREVWVVLTTLGRATLRRLAVAHRTELERNGPELARALNAVLRHAG